MQYHNIQIQKNEESNNNDTIIISLIKQIKTIIDHEQNDILDWSFTASNNVCIRFMMNVCRWCCCFSTTSTS